MSEPWLRSNLRLSCWGAVIWLAPAMGLLVWGCQWISHGPYRKSGWVVFLLGLILAASAIAWIVLTRQPRLLYKEGCLFVNMTVPRPIPVPIDVVECFFMGHGLAHLVLPAGKKTETVNVVVRLAERATPWRQVPVVRILGHWCDGYITIRGTWCEPLSADVVNRLNARLAEVKRNRKVSSLKEIEAAG